MTRSFEKLNVEACLSEKSPSEFDMERSSSMYHEGLESEAAVCDEVIYKKQERGNSRFFREWRGTRSTGLLISSDDGMQD